MVQYGLDFGNTMDNIYQYENEQGDARSTSIINPRCACAARVTLVLMDKLYNYA